MTTKTKYPKKDPLEKLIGLIKSKGKHDALEDLKKLDRGEYYEEKTKRNTKK